MREVLKLMPDYCCWPIWRAGGEVGNVDPEGLPLTAELKGALMKWARVFDATLDWDNPADSGFRSPAEEEAFEAEGRRLWRELIDQLGDDYQVVYFSNRDGQVHE
jgi:hypothetical protein